DRDIRGRLTPQKLDEIVDAIPEEWLNWNDAIPTYNDDNDDNDDNARERRETYRKFLKKRLQDVDIVKAVEDARAKQI
ncbi:MAG: hypothetical protein K2H71_08170, partial [Muribaculaceae bacterium]|nr:hypothetical protein [Muribaculaceae bacterium]